MSKEMKISIPTLMSEPEQQDKTQTEDDNQAELIAQSIVKRREWSEKYRISDAILFDLFSEFSSMMMIAKKNRK